jgi:dTDP-glucose pyrophosphorylase
MSDTNSTAEGRALSLVVLAAGMGSRFGGIKQIAELGPAGEALIDYSVYDALRAGFGDLHFVVRPDIEEAVRRFFRGKFDAARGVHWVHQTVDDVPTETGAAAEREKPWGTAHAVWSGRESVTRPFAVINGDDFYGREAFDTLAGALETVRPEEHRFFLVGYPLEKTLSPHGPVSRAICKVDSENNLIEIEEHHEIERIPDGRIFGTRGNGGSRVELTSGTYCSMNMMGFTPAFFPILTREFELFLTTSHDIKRAEFLLPTVLNKLLSEGEASVKVLPTDADWFGVTYAADVEAAQNALRQLVEKGVYPRPLW